MAATTAPSRRVAETTAYLRPHSRSAALFQAATRVLPGGNSRTTIQWQPYPPYIEYGCGCRLVDVDGEERLDFLSNYTALIHGHAHPHIVQAAAHAMERAASFSFPSQAEVELASRIVERLPSAEKVRFTNSGTEAVMMAIRLARAATGRDRIAKVEGCYHGSYDEARVSESAGLDALGLPERPNSVGERGLSRGSQQAVVTLPFNHSEAAAALVKEHASDLAAVLVDPAPNRAGLVPATPEYLQTLWAMTREHGVVLIFDEVITYRVGPSGMQGLLGITPDLTTLGKIIGGGLPVGAVAGRAELLDLFNASSPRSVAHGGTFNANPVTMAAGAAALDLLRDAEYERINHLAATLGARLEGALHARGYPCRVNVAGSLFQVHLREDRVTDYRSLMSNRVAQQRMGAFAAALLKRGTILSPNGLGCISTPMSECEVETFVAAAELAADEVFEAMPRLQ